MATASDSQIVDGALVSSSGSILVSSDALSWRTVAKDLAVTPRDVSYGNGRFVTVGSGFPESDSWGGSSRSQAFVSSDGEAWQTVDLPDSLAASHSAFGNGIFVVAGREHHLSSADGLLWTPFGPPSSDADRLGLALVDPARGPRDERHRVERHRRPLPGHRARRRIR